MMMSDADQNQGQDGQGEPHAPTWDAWYGAQDHATKALIENHTRGLKGALDAERTNRKELEKQVRGLAGKEQEGSAGKEQLTKLADDLASASKRAEAYEVLHAAGVSNLKAAYTLAVADDLFDRKGALDTVALKAAYPELFRTSPAPPGNGGSGTNSQAKAKGMNEFIRSQAGR